MCAMKGFFLCLLGSVLREGLGRNKESLSYLAADKTAHVCSLGHEKFQIGVNNKASMGFWKLNDQI